MNCNVLHCTATQPNFDNNQALRYPCFYGDGSKESSIIHSIESPEVFDRVIITIWLGEDLNTTLNTEDIIKHLKGQLENEQSALIVLNTKKKLSLIYIMNY